MVAEREGGTEGGRGGRDANLFSLTMLRQHSQYDSRLGFSFRVFVRVRLGLELVLGLGLGLILGLPSNPNENPKTKP